MNKINIDNAGTVQYIINEFKTYQEYSKRTIPDKYKKGSKYVDREDEFAYNCYFGTLGELGEVIDIYKKILFQNHSVTDDTVNNIKKELGDIGWYIAGFISNISDKSINKLYKTTQEQLDYYIKEKKNGNYVFDIIKTDTLIIDNIQITDIIKYTVDILHEAENIIDAYMFKLRNNKELKVLSIASLLCNYIIFITEIGFALPEILNMNKDKLNKRYKNGFSTEESENRNI